MRVDRKAERQGGGLSDRGGRGRALSFGSEGKGSLTREGGRGLSGREGGGGLSHSSARHSLMMDRISSSESGMRPSCGRRRAERAHREGEGKER